jgi:hypothetical protein
MQNISREATKLFARPNVSVRVGRANLQKAVIELSRCYSQYFEIVFLYLSQGAISLV